MKHLLFNHFLEDLSHNPQLSCIREEGHILTLPGIGVCSLAPAFQHRRTGYTSAMSFACVQKDKD